jgi:hypothetical protein
MKRYILPACLIPLLALAPMQSTLAADAGKLSLETGLDYNTGTYGGTQSTEIYYVPVTVKYQEAQDWSVKMTVPYLRITGPANVIGLINGTAVAGATTSTGTSTRSGWGDVLVAASHIAYNGGPAGLIVNVTGKIKFGTASAAEGLGTGKNDYAAQTDLYRVTGNHTVFGSIGYRVYGSPPGFQLYNGFYGSLGDSYKFTPETSGGILLNVGQKVILGGSMREDALAFVNHKFDKNWKVQGYFLKGFTNSVPDWGTGATLSYTF